MVLPIRFITLASRPSVVITKFCNNLRFFSTTTAAVVRISEVIKNNNRELEQAYKNILDAKTTDDKIGWHNQFTWELARHSIARSSLSILSLRNYFRWQGYGRQRPSRVSEGVLV
ncbi:hypothetical protein F5Y12DRAFT_710811 [Xylaria sp. FL1777]|nr:hypothetical protein F5Y12DRAFT_710811 [Xylaria sp. FL1777]